MVKGALLWTAATVATAMNAVANPWVNPLCHVEFDIVGHQASWDVSPIYCSNSHCEWDAYTTKTNTSAPNATATPTPGRRWRLMDTGCGHDIANSSTLANGQQRCVQQTNQPIVFSTANDVVSAHMQLPMKSPALGATDNQATLYCLSQSPDVLSVELDELCYRTQEHRFGRWIPSEQLFLLI